MFVFTAQKYAARRLGAKTISPFCHTPNRAEFKGCSLSVRSCFKADRKPERVAAWTLVMAGELLAAKVFIAGNVNQRILDLSDACQYFDYHYSTSIGALRCLPWLSQICVKFVALSYRGRLEEPVAPATQCRSNACSHCSLPSGSKYLMPVKASLF
jgi:hypothetical protein